MAEPSSKDVIAAARWEWAIESCGYEIAAANGPSVWVSDVMKDLRFGETSVERFGVFIYRKK